MPPGHPDTSGAAGPALEYQRPTDWQEAPPGQMRAASFRVAGKDGKQADVSVIPLPGMAGSDLDNVNRWRGQVGLPGVSEAELAKLAQPVEIAGQPATLYEQAGINPGSGEKTRILAAITRRDGAAWFFKMTGDDDLVAQQKPAFIEFLKSVTFPAAAAQAQLPPSHPPIDAGSMMAQAGVGAFLRPVQTQLAGAVRLEGSPRRAIPGGQIRPPWRRRRAGRCECQHVAWRRRRPPGQPQSLARATGPRARGGS